MKKNARRWHSGKIYKMRLRDSDPLKSTLALYTQDTVSKGEEPSFTRLQDVVRRNQDQKIEDRNFGARRDEKTAQGVAGK